ncbi:hypothetical protein DCO58_00345 [Helicobacter saguini]|uniref:Uncharacterized protein n=1 Tax=Helicobacter saguini TaxID=1548018 RepID=A0A347VQU3_9HELI|nr:hypothetical protein [Helicobacter saguini]MWV63157.1 hypothetical protein [Helicobacter saguini]MWV66173.1 hypothetical protein [Helicobacter saguini]MWV68522.1 hypothetical protein [Helicobacter saguini]MWV71923.1 hypothetical protein [Helicobacter saguini]TLD95935.1 hypothetical protein LS64_000810 [Helicobacter saguini]
MDAVFPFDKVTLVYEGSEFLVGFGKNTRNRNKYSVGLRWKSYKYDGSDNTGFPYDSSKKGVWFMIPIHLSAAFLETLKGNKYSKKDALDNAIKLLKEQN